MTMVEMNVRLSRGSPAEESFAPRIIHLALFGTIAHRQAISVSDDTSKQPVKANVAQVRQLFPDIPNCFEFGASRVKMNSAGVFCKEVLAKGSVLGPYSGRKVSPEEVENCTSSCKEGLWEIYRGSKVQWYIDASDPNHKNWMYFIQSARNEEEQTLSALQYGEALYFKALRDIRAGEELLVWYDKKQYELYMGLPTAFHQMVPLLQRVEGGTPQLENDAEEEEVEEDTVSVGSAENPIDVEEMNDEEEEAKSEEEEAKSEEEEDDEEEDEEQKSPPPFKFYYDKPDYSKPISNHHPHPSLMPGGLHLHKPFICNPIPPSLPLQPHHPPPSAVSTPGIFVYPLHPVNVPGVHWINKPPHVLPHTPPHHPHPLLSPSALGAKTPMVPWQCRSLHTPPAISPRQDDKFMFVRLADSTHWQCKLCNRVFTSQGSLRAHARIHNNEKPYRCKYCQRSFTQASTLRSHERLHTGEKPYKCETCGKCFTQSAGLRSHKKTHTTR